MSNIITSNEHFLKRARNIRNELLNKTDRYMLEDYPNLTPEELKSIKDYRHALREFININKEKKSNTQWHSVVLWNSLSDLSSMIGKGDLIYVEGRLNYRVKNTDNHSERYTEVVAKTIRILRKANSKEEVKIDFNEDEFFD